MEYENPKIPEGINVSDTHPLKDFALLAIGILLAASAIILLLYIFADRITPLVPLKTEIKWGEQLNIQSFFTDESSASNSKKTTEEEKTAKQKVTQYLSQLTQRIATAQGIPEDIELTVVYSNSEEINAFAMFGGILVINKGLLKRLPNENALTMLLAHEVAHVKNRDAIQAMSKGILLTTVVGLFGSAGNNTMIETLFSQAGLVALLKFSRDQEADADEAAFYSLQALYGHTYGSESLFKALEAAPDIPSIEWFSSHPLTEDRLKSALKRNQQFSSNFALTPLAFDSEELP